MSKGNVYYDSKLCGILEETDNGYRFSYTDEWFNNSDTPSISLTMPKDRRVYESTIFFPFFDGLIPEGYLLQLVVGRWGYQFKDRFKILLKSVMDTIGAVTIKEAKE